MQQDSVTEVKLGRRSKGMLVTCWKWGVSCLAARTPPADNLDEAALVTALTWLQLFLIVFHSLLRFPSPTPILYLTSTQSFLETSICVALGTHHVNTIQPESDSTGSGAFVGRWCRWTYVFCRSPQLKNCQNHYYFTLQAGSNPSNERQRLQAGGLRFLCESRCREKGLQGKVRRIVSEIEAGSD